MNRKWWKEAVATKCILGVSMIVTMMVSVICLVLSKIRLP